MERSAAVGSHTAEKIDVTESTGLDSILGELGFQFAGRSSVSRWFSPSEAFELASEVHDLFVLRGASERAFEPMAERLAVASGVRFLRSSSVADAAFNGDSVSSLMLDVAGKSISIRPRWVVLADGFASPTSRLLGLPVSKDLVEYHSFGVVGANVRLPEMSTHVFLDSEILGAGYVYAANCGSVGTIASAISCAPGKRRDAKAAFTEFLAKNSAVGAVFSGVENKRFFAGMSVAGKPGAVASGNILVVGDAARTLDPLFGYGVRQAILSGYAAANSIAAESRLGVDAGSRYSDWYRGTMTPEHDFSMRARQLLVSMSNKDLDAIVGGLGHASQILGRHRVESYLSAPHTHPLTSTRVLTRRLRLLRLLVRAFRLGLLV